MKALWKQGAFFCVSDHVFIVMLHVMLLYRTDTEGRDRSSSLLFFLHAAILLSLLSCGPGQDTITVASDRWPASTRIALFATPSGQTRASLHGSRTTLLIRHGGLHRIRASHPDYLSFLSDTLRFSEKDHRFTLPSPVPRRRIAGWRFGFSVSDPPVPDSLLSRLIDESYTAITTISPALARRDLADAAAEAHARGLEFIAAHTLTTGNREKIHLAVKEAERAGADGIVVNIATEIRGDPAGVDALRRFAFMTKERGMTFAVRAEVDCMAGGDALPDLVKHLMTGTPDIERPGGIRLAFMCRETAVYPAIETIEETVEKAVGAGIPLSRISVELHAGAVKYRVDEENELTRVPVEPGELDGLIAGMGGDAFIRLRDGTCRLGYRGYLYVFADGETISRTVSLMRRGSLARSAGIHVVFDNTGTSPTPEALVRIASAAEGT